MDHLKFVTPNSLSVSDGESVTKDCKTGIEVPEEPSSFSRRQIFS